MRIIYLLIVLVLAACSSKNATTTQGVLTPIVKEETVQKEMPVAPPVKSDTVKQVIKETPKATEELAKDYFNVAVILPFDVDQVPLNYSPFRLDSNKVLSDDTKNAIEFYLGLKKGIDLNAPDGLKANFFVLDDKNSTDKLQQLLKERPFPEVDLIIGPLKDQGVTFMANFAKGKKIPIVAPYTFSNDVVNENPYYYSAFPTEDAHLEYIFETILRKHPNAIIDVIRDMDDSDIIQWNQLLRAKAMVEKRTKKAIIINEIPFAVGKTDVIEKGNWTFTSEETLPHIVLIPSNKDSFVRYLLGQLTYIKNPLTIYGLPSWAKMKILDLSDEFKHMIYLSSGVPKEISNKQDAFYKSYQDEFYKEPTEYSFMGYDLTTYILSQMNKGKFLFEKSPSEIGAKVVANKFVFKPVISVDGNLQYYTNTTLYLLQLQNFKFIPVAE